MSPYQIAELAILRLSRYPEKLNVLMVLDVIFFDEIGQLPAETFSAIEIILRRVRKNDIFLGGVLLISTMDHTQLQPVTGRPFLLSTHVITCFKMIKLQKSVRASGDLRFQRLQEIIRMHYSKYIEKPELLDELRLLLKEVPTYVTNWSSPEISSDTYRLYGRRTPANEATQNLINAIRSNISSENLREKQASDKQRLRLSLSDWGPASEETSKKLNKKVKEPSTLLFFKGAIYEFTHNLDEKYSQGQMALLFDLPNQEQINQNRKINVLAAPTGLHDIVYDNNKSKNDYIRMGFYEVKVGLASFRTIAINRHQQAQRKQYALRHRVTSTIHAAMGEALNKIAIQITESMFELWDKAQVIVALTRTKIGKNVIIVGDMQETINAIISLIQTRIQWTNYMENILDLITVGENIEERVPILNYRSFPFRICDISLPQSKTGFVYFLISVRNLDYTYIGECSFITKKLYHHISGYGSTSTAPGGCGK